MQPFDLLRPLGRLPLLLLNLLHHLIPRLPQHIQHGGLRLLAELIRRRTTLRQLRRPLLSRYHRRRRLGLLLSVFALATTRAFVHVRPLRVARELGEEGLDGLVEVDELADLGDHEVLGLLGLDLGFGAVGFELQEVRAPLRLLVGFGDEEEAGLDLEASPAGFVDFEGRGLDGYDPLSIIANSLNLRSCVFVSLTSGAICVGMVQFELHFFQPCSNIWSIFCSLYVDLPSFCVVGRSTGGLIRFVEGPCVRADYLFC